MEWLCRHCQRNVEQCCQMAHSVGGWGSWGFGQGWNSPSHSLWRVTPEKKTERKPSENEKIKKSNSIGSAKFIWMKLLDCHLLTNERRKKLQIGKSQIDYWSVEYLGKRVSNFLSMVIKLKHLSQKDKLLGSVR